ncbi:MAG: hypothetical protein NT076_01245 [Candidatus Pacearchaeota archaeon]|nr:hypothetical protein [Candidatus Pacearchaeota archaeon]
MQTNIQLTKQNPELLDDVKLFKIILTPLELFVLRYILTGLHPFNIREIYVKALHLLLIETFGDKVDVEETKKTDMHFIEDLSNAGYNGVYFQEKEKSEETDKLFSGIKNLSSTRANELFYKKLKSLNVKVPSYDIFKAIVERFESVGIVYKRAKQEKIILYALDTNFYKLFKDKIEEIKKL